MTFFSAFSLSFGLLLVLMTAMASWTFRTANAPLIAKLVIPASIFTLACATPNAMNSLLGFPVTVAFAALPARAALVAFVAHDGERVVDLWLRQGDAAPRAYETPLDETARAMGDLMRQGKIRYFGVSNYRGWRVAEICNICDHLGIDRPVVSQPYYNAMNRMPETEHLPACAYYGLGVVAYSPLARGVLTGKYRPDTPASADSRAGREDLRMMQTEWRPESLQNCPGRQATCTAARHFSRTVCR